MHAEEERREEGSFPSEGVRGFNEAAKETGHDVYNDLTGRDEDQNTTVDRERGKPARSDYGTGRNVVCG